jgi:trans-aconitate methyltransferase
MPTAAADVWASGDAYEPYVGRWSRLVAREFLAWLAVPPAAAWLDVGCGTGALTSVILAEAAPARVEAVDPALPYVRFAESRVRNPRAVFVNADAQALPQPSQSIDATVSALALNFIRDPHVAVAEMTRVTAAGGVVAAYVWDYAGEMQLMRRFWDAAAALDPHAATLDEARRFPICHPAALESLFRGARLQNVETRAIDVPTRFTDFDDYWQPFLGGQGPAPTYAMALADERRAALRERIRDALPVAADGSIELIARAWAVRGRRA